MDKKKQEQEKIRNAVSICVGVVVAMIIIGLFASGDNWSFNPGFIIAIIAIASSIGTSKNKKKDPSKPGSILQSGDVKGTFDRGEDDKSYSVPATLKQKFEKIDSSATIGATLKSQKTDEHSHDRLTGYNNDCSQEEHWKKQLDGFLASGIITKSEYKELLKQRTNRN